MKPASHIKKTVKNIQPECFSNGRYAAPNKMEIHFKNIIASEAIYSEGLSSVWHYHENPHFSHILSGGSLELREYDYQLQSAGHAMFYNPCMLHKNTGYKKNTRIFNLELRPVFFTENNIKYSAFDNYWSNQDEYFKKFLLIKILSEYRTNDAHSEIAVEQLSVLICQNEGTNYKTIKNNHWSSVLKDYLYANWNKSFTLKQLSEQVNIHPVNISRYFSKYFNCTLGAYVRRIKIEKSLPLIRDKNYSLTEIAYESGFADQSHFSKTFKEITGVLPKVYRNF